MSGEPGSESPTTPGAPTSQPSGSFSRPRGLRTIVSMSIGLLLWYAGSVLGLRLPGGRSRAPVHSNPGVSTQELPEQILQPGQGAWVWRRRADPEQRAWTGGRFFSSADLQEIELRSWTRRWDWGSPDGVVLQLADGTQIVPMGRQVHCSFAT